MNEKERNGLLGEIYASRYLRENGFLIMSANVRRRLGEIDIIASRDNCICFVEVKTRSKNSTVRAAEFVDKHKQRKIASVAKQYLQNEPDCTARFDVIEIYLDGNGDIHDINHIRNAFELS